MLLHKIISSINNSYNFTVMKRYVSDVTFRRDLIKVHLETARIDKQDHDARYKKMIEIHQLLQEIDEERTLVKGNIYACLLWFNNYKGMLEYASKQTGRSALEQQEPRELEKWFISSDNKKQLRQLRTIAAVVSRSEELTTDNAPIYGYMSTGFVDDTISLLEWVISDCVIHRRKRS